MAESQNVIGDNEFKKFWSRHKESLSVVGIMATISALFLTIPIPENETAKTALQMVQLLWLVAFTISVIWFCWVLLLFSFKLEDGLSKNIKFDLGNQISTCVMSFACYLVYNLWQYMTVLYRTEWLKMVRMIENFILSLGIIIFLQLFTNIYLKYWEVSKFNFIGLGFATCMGFSFIPTIWSTFFKLQFSMEIFLKNLISNLCLFSVIGFGMSLFLLYKYRKNKFYGQRNKSV